MHNSRRFPVPVFAVSRILFRISSTFEESLFDFIEFNLSICFLLTSVLSISRISISFCFKSDLKELMPMMNSSPLSIFACLMADASSILIFGIPASMALVIPPSFSTSSMNFIASSIICWVKVSIK
ncbi:hypothetical protein D3C86_1425730 [compost metagenome]